LNPEKFSLPALDKAPVFALRLNRRGFAKKPPDLIRRKFSIDTGQPSLDLAVLVASTISKPYGRDVRKPGVHHLH
jgi:hypothetical protein